jgi:delta-1-pyrroline-5-carboxylate synthetase
LVAGHIGADLMVLLTDVEGLYDKAPSEDGAKLINVFCRSTVAPVFGEGGALGRGGMKAKIAAALRAVDRGVPAVVVTNGRRDDSLVEVVQGKDVGTMIVASVKDFTPDANKKERDAFATTKEKAVAAKAAGRHLVAVGPEGRTKILHAVADALLKNADEIIAANAEDLKAAEETELEIQLKRRLTMTKEKLLGVIDGVRQLANMDDPVGDVLAERLVAQGVKLSKVTTPIGTLMVIFESRPDCLPQIAALCLRSGNSVILKGGKEAEASNRALHRVLTSAIEAASNGVVSGAVIGLVSSRSEIKSLLKLNAEIDLVVPRGSNAMVAEIQRSTTIPVLGHADGVCHVYVHAEADVAEAMRLLLDAKMSYPAACNAAETLLLDSNLEDGTMNDIIVTLRKAGVRMFGGRQAVALGLVDNAAESLHTEYGDLRMTVEVVNSVTEAIAHINAHGSHHTDTIVTNNLAIAKQFTDNVDSACTFHNVSTRMADGYRFGLGAEVGISTSRIHARGPVGVEGLLTFKWVMAAEAQGEQGVAPVPGPFDSPCEESPAKGRVCLTVADFEAEKKKKAE